MPHHGAFTGASQRWLTHVAPEIALQSSGLGRLRKDRWPASLEAASISRYATVRYGMIEIDINRDGTISARPFVQWQTNEH